MWKRPRVWLLGIFTVLLLLLVPTVWAMALAPANDAFASARVLGPLPASVSQATGGATKEAGEPVPTCGGGPNMGSTVWFSYTSWASGTLLADTEGSGFDTVVVVYTGSSLATLTEIVCDDDSGTGLNSRVVFGVDAGTTYWFQVGGWYAASGALTLNLTSGPVVGAMPDMTVEATGPSGAVVSFVNPPASGLNPVPPVASCDPMSGSVFPLGSTLVVCSATDSLGLTGWSSFTVTVVDTTAPALAMPDMTVEATGHAGAVVNFTATATDAVSPTPAVMCLPASGSLFPLGATTVACSVVDGAGNIGHGSFTITVADTTGPQMTVPGSATVEATGPDGATVAFTAAAADLVGPLSPVVTCLPASGSVLPLGTTTVECSARDAAGNPGSGSFTITVVDTTPPEITIPGAMVIEATGPSGASAAFTVFGWDLVGPPSPAATCLPASGSTFPLGTTTVQCSAQDAAGNVGHASFTVEVADTTGPMITLLGPSYVLQAVGTRYVDAGATAYDLVDGDLSGAISAANWVNWRVPGIYEVTYRVRDGAGNPAVPVTRRVEVAYFCAGAQATLWGSPGDDTLFGTSRADVIVGLGGADTIYGLGGDDLVCGGFGDDILYGGGGADTLLGQFGADQLWGGFGDDYLWGGPGLDLLFGGLGNDVFDGVPE